MKTIGMIGGMSWESTAIYYRLLNEAVRGRLGGLHSAKLVLWSADFAEIEALQAAGDWDAATEILTHAARAVERGGADCLIICTNTMHRMADEVQASVAIPLLHIADPTGVAITAAGGRRPLLLATRYTMEQPFYRDRLAHRHGLDVMVPNEEDRGAVHDVIYDELCRGVVRADSRQRYRDIVERAVAAGADGVIFGCTEVGMLLRPQDVSVPAFDTTVLHVTTAVDFALAADPAGDL